MEEDGDWLEFEAEVEVVGGADEVGSSFDGRGGDVASTENKAEVDELLDEHRPAADVEEDRGHGRGVEIGVDSRQRRNRWREGRGMPGRSKSSFKIADECKRSPSRWEMAARRGEFKEGRFGDLR